MRDHCVTTLQKPYDFFQELHASTMLGQCLTGFQHHGHKEAQDLDGSLGFLCEAPCMLTPVPNPGLKKSLGQLLVVAWPCDALLEIVENFEHDNVWRPIGPVPLVYYRPRKSSELPLSTTTMCIDTMKGVFKAVVDW